MLSVSRRSLPSAVSGSSVPRACSSCRSQLLRIWECGFSTSAAEARVFPRTKLQGQPSSPRNVVAKSSDSGRTIVRIDSRTFSTTITAHEKPSSNQTPTPSSAVPPVGEDTTAIASSDSTSPEEAELDSQTQTASIEEFVLNTRRTFGETLPKDYLGKEEYALYERLYGAPLRETRGEDLGLINSPESSTEAPTGKQNALLREDGEGGFEEVELRGGVRFRDGEEEANEELWEDSEALDEVTSVEEYARLESDTLEESDAAAENEDQFVEEMTLSEEDDLLNETLDHENAAALDEQPHESGAPQYNRRELDAIEMLRADMERHNMQIQNEAQEDDLEEGLEEDSEETEEYVPMEAEEGEDAEEWQSGDSVRSHPHTIAGRWGTNPSTLQLPKDEFVGPVSELLARTDPKHLSDAAHKAFGGIGLPYSSATPALAKKIPQKHIGLEAAQHKMTEIEADAYIAAVMPATYAAVMSTLVETRKRLGQSWIRDLFSRNRREGPRVLDAGAGGAGLVAWRALAQAEWDVLRDEGVVKKKEPPVGKSTVLTGPSTLRHRSSRLLENTTFLPRLPDYVHASNVDGLDDSKGQRKTFDVIIAPHTLLPLKEDFKRKSQISNLWSLLEPNGGVLIIIEKGIPRGFEAVAGARSLLLRSFVSSPDDSIIEGELQDPNTIERFRKKEPGMIIAPCTNHSTCPMYKIEGTSAGRKDFCHFEQRFIRPPYLQKILGAKGRNHEDVKFSYVAIRRGVDIRSPSPTVDAAEMSNGLVQNEAATLAALAGYESTGDTRTDSTLPDPNFYAQSLPRAILSPLKRHGHVTLDLCTPSGQIERWTVPKSFSAQAYRDARKSSWGDLWALGAKVRTMRNIRLGREYVQREARDGSVGAEKIQTTKGGRLGGTKRQGEGMPKNKSKGRRAKDGGTDVFEIDVGDQGMEGVRMARPKYIDPTERRTKGGRKEGRQRKIRDNEF